MTHPMADDRDLPSTLPAEFQPFQSVCLAFLEHLVPLLLSFCSQPPTPQATHQFESDLFDRLKGQIQRDCRFHIVVTRLEVGGYCAQCRTAPPA